MGARALVLSLLAVPVIGAGNSDVVWTRTSEGSTFRYLLVAVPAPGSAVAVFAAQADGTVLALRPDGSTEWKADLTAVKNMKADFQGGLTAIRQELDASRSIAWLDPATGRWSTGQRLGGPWSYLFAVHPDGSVYALRVEERGHTEIVAFEQPGGEVRFRVPLEEGDDWAGEFLVAGDGCVYLSIEHRNPNGGGRGSLQVLRIQGSGSFSRIPVTALAAETRPRVYMISNGSAGALLSWKDGPQPGLALITEKGAETHSLEASLVPILQSGDTFVGNTGGATVGFDRTGKVLWRLPGSWAPLFATPEGGVVARACNGSTVVQLDAEGRIEKHLPELIHATLDWEGRVFTLEESRIQLHNLRVRYGSGFYSLLNGNPSANSVAVPVTDTPGRGPVWLTPRTIYHDGSVDDDVPEDP